MRWKFWAAVYIKFGDSLLVWLTTTNPMSTFIQCTWLTHTCTCSSVVSRIISAILRTDNFWSVTRITGNCCLINFFRRKNWLRAAKPKEFVDFWKCLPKRACFTRLWTPPLTIPKAWQRLIRKSNYTALTKVKLY